MDWRNLRHLTDRSTGGKRTFERGMPLNSSETERNSVNSTCFTAAPVVAFCLLMVHPRHLPLLCNALLQRSLCNLQIYFLYHSSPAMFWDRDCIDRLNIWTVVLYFLQVSSPLPPLSICNHTLFSLSSYLEKILQGRRVIFYKTRSHRRGIKNTKHTYITPTVPLAYNMHTFIQNIYVLGGWGTAMLIHTAHINTPETGR